ncbi:hypothetical protein BDZ89DRAFT_1039754 [Hymenopellis radicata]|nr:hypothetical protein BDZ89DRAFT_1039754 [Hymenopellis radicata]
MGSPVLKVHGPLGGVVCHTTTIPNVKGYSTTAVDSIKACEDNSRWRPDVGLRASASAKSPPPLVDPGWCYISAISILYLKAKARPIRYRLGRKGSSLDKGQSGSFTICVAGNYAPFPGIVAWLGNDLSGQYKRALGMMLHIGVGGLSAAVASNI